VEKGLGYRGKKPCRRPGGIRRVESGDDKKRDIRPNHTGGKNTGKREKRCEVFLIKSIQQQKKQQKVSSSSWPSVEKRKCAEGGTKKVVPV